MPPNTYQAHPTDAPVAKDAMSTASKPQGTLDDQVANMENEGQAQPQAGDVEEEEEAGSPSR